MTKKEFQKTKFSKDTKVKFFSKELWTYCISKVDMIDFDICAFWFITHERLRFWKSYKECEIVENP